MILGMLICGSEKSIIRGAASQIFGKFIQTDSGFIFQRLILVTV
jgi:hypothetical protein